MSQIKIKSDKQTDNYKSALFRRLVYVASMVMLVGIWCLPVFSIQVHAMSETDLSKEAISELTEKVEDLQSQLNMHVQNDVSISKIEKTATEGNVDTYTITMTNGTIYNFVVTNGQDGKDGVDGIDGKNGIDGRDGVNCKSAYELAVENGYQGDLVSWLDSLVGQDGIDGVGISKIEKTATEGNVDTYTITMTNGTIYNFVVTNGQDGKDGMNGKDIESTVSQTISNDGTDSPMVVISMLIASISLVGNMVMAVLMAKNKKI